MFTPRTFIREFIQGKTVRYLRPISLLIITATFYGLLYHWLDLDLIHILYFYVQ
ncbi:DUF3667 domain-containing protein [Galbibacter pacificus]|uniref:DUF3667 domain-containing protein n=1 Tax=Galbibacter pacificus TaxID=2996052 RepID=UPI0038B2D3B0